MGPQNAEGPVRNLGRLSRTRNHRAPGKNVLQALVAVLCGIRRAKPRAWFRWADLKERLRKGPEKLGYETPLWTCPRVADFLAALVGRIGHPLTLN